MPREKESDLYLHVVGIGKVDSYMKRILHYLSLFKEFRDSLNVMFWRLHCPAVIDKSRQERGYSTVEFEELRSVGRAQA